MLRDRSRILIVDDEEPNVRVLTRLLSRAGLANVRGITDPRDAVRVFEEFQPDLVLLDVNMPGLSGFEVLSDLGPHVLQGVFVPVLMVTGSDSLETRHRALAGGASDFITKPYDAVEVVLRIRNLLEMRRLHVTLADYSVTLEERVRERTQALDEAQIEIIERLSDAAEFRDDDTGHHTQRVGALAERIAAAMGLAGAELELIRRAAPLHDIGKIGIEDGILRKAGRLAPQERERMQMHTTIGARILTDGRSPLLQMSERIALSHHERWDGAGYPHGLDGERIPQEARIVALADVFDALTSDRPYRPAWPVDRVRAMVREERGKHFDPAVVDAFEALSPPAGVDSSQLPG